MKRTTGVASIAMIMAVLTVSLSVISCKKESQSLNPVTELSAQNVNNSANISAPLKINLDHVYAFVEDANAMPATGDNALLFDTRGHTPVLAPDGHQITLGEYNKVSGWADIKCTEMGTHAVFHLQGLIPNGVYTIWTLTFKSPGFNGTFVNQIGNGAFGAPDGSQNAFTASADGTAALSVTMPAESLSLFGSVPNCLGDVFETHLVAAYHSDNQTHGGTPGDPSTWIVQFAFPFHGSQL